MEEKEKGGTQSLWKKIKNVAQCLWEKIKSLAQCLWEKIKSFFRRRKICAVEHPVRCAIGGAVLAPVLFVLAVCWVEGKWPDLRALDMDQWVSLLGGSLAYVGTCFLGILSFWQNSQLKEINEKMRKLEKNKLRPILGVEWAVEGLPVTILNIYNYKSDPILDIKIEKIGYVCKDVSYLADEIEIKVLKESTKLSEPFRIHGRTIKKAEGGDKAVLSGTVKCINTLGKEYEDSFEVEFGGRKNMYFKKHSEEKE